MLFWRMQLQCDWKICVKSQTSLLIWPSWLDSIVNAQIAFFSHHAIWCDRFFVLFCLVFFFLWQCCDADTIDELSVTNTADSDTAFPNRKSIKKNISQSRLSFDASRLKANRSHDARRRCETWFEIYSILLQSHKMFMSHGQSKMAMIKSNLQ